MLRLPRDSNIIINFPNSHPDDLSRHIENYLTEIRTITRLNNIQLSSSIQLSKYSFRDYLTDDIELIFNLNDDQQTRELVEKHEERLSKQVEKLNDDKNINETIMKFHQENNDAENIEREQRRREILIEDIKLTKRRHETFVQLAQKRTIIEKKNKRS
jgi:hypothetical protein